MVKVQSLNESIEQVKSSLVGTTWTIEVSEAGLLFKNNIGEIFEVRNVGKPDKTGFRQISGPWLTLALEQYGSPSKIAKAYGWDARQFTDHIAKTFGYKHSETKIAARQKVLDHYQSAQRAGLPLEVSLLAAHYRLSPGIIYKWIKEFENGKVLPDKRGRKVGTGQKTLKSKGRKTIRKQKKAAKVREKHKPRSSKRVK
jgi:transposase-like protein